MRKLGYLPSIKEEVAKAMGRYVYIELVTPAPEYDTTAYFCLTSDNLAQPEFEACSKAASIFLN